MSWNEIKETRLKDLQDGYDILQQALQDRKFPEPSSIPPNVLETSAYTGLLGLLLLILMIPKSRRFLFNTVESILAVICIILLLGVVIGMPFGAIYIGAKGVGFLVASLMHAFPQIGELLASVQGMVGKAKA